MMLKSESTPYRVCIYAWLLSGDLSTYRYLHRSTENKKLCDSQFLIICNVLHERGILYQLKHGKRKHRTAFGNIYEVLAGKIKCPCKRQQPSFDDIQKTKDLSFNATHHLEPSRVLIYFRRRIESSRKNIKRFLI